MSLLSRLIFFIAVTTVATRGQLLVTLPNGQIKGHELKTFTNKSYYGYQGIPYAKPPLGNLRFQAPQPSENWTGILEATKDSNKCFQMTYDDPAENEDCLYINVFTPVLNASKSGSPKLPVIFWIYGGTFTHGAASYHEFRPDYWMDEDVVLVTHNYRVGIFGLLSTGDSVIPGNSGLKDQNLALKWAHENIHLFGGDRDKITIHGQSAGALSVGYHLLIEQSSGLFRSAIAESGSAMNTYAFIETPREYAVQLVQVINPSISSNVTSEEIRDFLLSLDGRTIDSYSGATQIAQPGIVIEAENPTAVVTQPMFEKFKSGNFSQVPILMGINSEEGISIATSNLVEVGSNYDKNPSLVVPEIFPHDPDVDKNLIGEAIKEIYIDKSDKWENHPGRVVRHFSDQRFCRAIIEQAKLMSKLVPVYFYQFSYDGEVGGWSTVVEDAEKVKHIEELYYVFLNRSLSEISENDALTHKRLVRLWSNFVKHKNPTPEENQLLDHVIWPQVNETDFPYLNINVTLSLENHPKGVFFLGWEQVFEKYGKRPFSTY